MKHTTILVTVSLAAAAFGCSGAGNGKAWVSETVEDDAAKNCETEEVENEDGDAEERCKQRPLVGTEPAPME